MQATLCDNCQKPADTPIAMDGWRKMVRLKVHRVNEDDRPANPLAALMGGHAPQDHLDSEGEHDLCSDACLIAFVQNDYVSSLVSMANDLTPEQFSDPVTTTEPLEDES